MVAKAQLVYFTENIADSWVEHVCFKFAHVYKLVSSVCFQEFGNTSLEFSGVRVRSFGNTSKLL